MLFGLMGSIPCCVCFQDTGDPMCPLKTLTKSFLMGATNCFKGAKRLLLVTGDPNPMYRYITWAEEQLGIRSWIPSTDFYNSLQQQAAFSAEDSVPGRSKHYPVGIVFARRARSWSTTR